MNGTRKYPTLSLLVTCLLGMPIVRAQLGEAATIQRSLGSISDSIAYVDALNRLAMLSYETSADTTFHYAVRARQIADRLQYDKGKADAINNLGVVYDIKGNQQLALKYYNDAHMAYGRLNDTMNRVQTAMNIAGVYKQLGKDERSVEQFDAALSLGHKLKHDSILSLVIYNYLLLFPDRFTPDETLRYIQEAKMIASRYDDVRTLIAIDHLVAGELLKQGERQAGIALWDSTINSAVQKQLYYVSMDMLIGIGDYLAPDNAPRAVAYYRRGLEIADEHSYLFYSRVMARRLFDLYTARNEQAEAVAYGRMLVELFDEQEHLDNTASIDYLDYAIKEQQVERLAEKSRYQTFFLVLAIFGCLLAVGIIVVIRRALRTTRRLNARIVEQNQQMRKTLDALEQSQTENTRMMQIVAHDLRNPIGAIGSAASLMLEAVNRPPVEQKMLELIRKSATDSLDLASDLLQVHKQADDLPKDAVDLDRILRDCVDLMENKAMAKSQRIELRSQPSVVFANREKLWRVVSNLIANAIKFSPIGERISVTLEVASHHVVISVKDRGIGIPESLGTKIFDMFTEARRPGTDGEQPFGLGLAISKHIVEAHHGRIWFESHPERTPGTTFFVELPA
ncbi:tetratricopeptide repeat-containing sensor histidine kinase [Parapedobacter pyrenivorans]|uniref:tetratricopeptide repeat-containing sensor histidine kinase n=1 Tax=Parapedobacter pyrenivorans TaxID=1305674 RepID=UPI00333F7603